MTYFKNGKFQFPYTIERRKALENLYRYEREGVDRITELSENVSTRGLANQLFLERKLNLFIHLYSYIYAILDMIKMRKRMVYYYECIQASINSFDEYDELLDAIILEEGD